MSSELGEVKPFSIVKCIFDLVISTDLDISGIYVMKKDEMKMQSHIGLQLKYFEGKKEGFGWS